MATLIAIPNPQAGALTIITIDGPAASGKTSVSRALAQRHGWDWVSTGAFYRGLAHVALQEGVDLNNEEALAQLCKSDVWSVQMAEHQTLVLYKGQDVTNDIFKEETGTAASRVSQYPSVRQNLLEAQRACASGRTHLIAEGRDCGTVVFPQAELKIFLTAHQESRATRRAQEQGRDADQIKKEQAARDKMDSSRATAPMAIPADAVVVDTSQMNLDQVVDHIDRLIGKEIL